MSHFQLGKKVPNRPVWHAVILNKKKERVCSGAIIATKRYGKSVLTTAACAKMTSKNGYVSVGRKNVKFSIRTIKTVKNGLRLIVLVGQARKLKNIKIARFKSLRGSCRLRALGANKSFRIVDTTLSKTKCKQAFRSFKGFKEICTLPAGLPQNTKNKGSPLVQKIGKRVYLIGLLTGAVKSPSSGAWFGKYVRVNIHA